MIRFYFDYVSPYAYLGATQIRALGRKHGHEVEPIPVLFAGLLEASGAPGPAEIPVRREYLFRDVARLASYLEVPMEPPASHPYNPLAALRISLAVEDREERWRLVDALFAAVWVEGRAIDTIEQVGAIAAEAGLDGPALAARATAPETKLLLRTTTEGAVKAGVFGVPTMTVGHELFWGVDSLHLLDHFLAGKKVPDPQTIARWLAVTPTAIRRSRS